MVKVFEIDIPGSIEETCDAAFQAWHDFNDWGTYIPLDEKG